MKGGANEWRRRWERRWREREKKCKMDVGAERAVEGGERGTKNGKNVATQLRWTQNLMKEKNIRKQWRSHVEQKQQRLKKKRETNLWKLHYIKYSRTSSTNNTIRLSTLHLLKSLIPNRQQTGTFRSGACRDEIWVTQKTKHKKQIWPTIGNFSTIMSCWEVFNHNDNLLVSKQKITLHFLGKKNKHDDPSFSHVMLSLGLNWISLGF